MRALGRYDCLVWACLFDIALPCPSLRRDALDPAPFAAVRDAALRELSEEGLEKVEVSGLIPVDIAKLPHKGTLA